MSLCNVQVRHDTPGVSLPWDILIQDGEIIACLLKRTRSSSRRRLITRMGAIVVGGIGIVLASIGIVTTIVLTAG